MIRTPLCDLLGIEHPIIQGPLGGPWMPGVELVAAVSNAGALGSLATALRTPDEVREDIAEVRGVTDRPFAVNHTMRPLVPEVLEAVLAAGPPAISFALGIVDDLAQRAHDVGSRFIQQIHTVDQAKRAADLGVDAIIAQGNEAGGFGGAPGTLVLVPQVVDAVRPVPVVAAGGIADGRGLAAALVLGAQAVNVGTRFLASDEAAVPDGYKQLVVRAQAERTVRASFVSELVPPATPGAFTTAPRLLRDGFVEEWMARPAEFAAQLDRLRQELRQAMAGDRAHEMLPVVGESVGLIHDVLPAAEVVRLMVEEAETILGAAAELVT
jgi:enoyl-[acyl-carrier protein] reductase II